MSRPNEEDIKIIRETELQNALYNALEDLQYRLIIEEVYYSWSDDDNPSDNSSFWNFIATTNSNASIEKRMVLTDRELEHFKEVFKDYDIELPFVPISGAIRTRITLGYSKYTVTTPFQEFNDFIINELIKLENGQN